MHNINTHDYTELNTQISASRLCSSSFLLMNFRKEKTKIRQKFLLYVKTKRSTSFHCDFAWKAWGRFKDLKERKKDKFFKTFISAIIQVTTGGLADQGGIRLGDIILEINEEDATQLTLAQAHEKIDATGKKIHFLVKT